MKHVLVTGGAGFIDSRLIDRLMVGGCHATVADNCDSFYGPSIKHANLIGYTAREGSNWLRSTSVIRHHYAVG